MYQNQTLAIEEALNPIRPVLPVILRRVGHTKETQNKAIESDRDQHMFPIAELDVVKPNSLFPREIIAEQAREFAKEYYNEIRLKPDSELQKQRDALKPKSFWGKILFHIDLYTKIQYEQINRVLQER